MNGNNRYILTIDVNSHYKDRQGKSIVYGKRLDIVKEIADHDNVMIVERNDGFRFPALKTQLQKI